MHGMTQRVAVGSLIALNSIAAIGECTSATAAEACAVQLIGITQDPDGLCRAIQDNDCESLTSNNDKRICYVVLGNGGTVLRGQIPGLIPPLGMSAGQFSAMLHNYALQLEIPFDGHDLDVEGGILERNPGLSGSGIID